MRAAGLAESSCLTLSRRGFKGIYMQSEVINSVYEDALRSRTGTCCVQTSEPLSAIAVWGSGLLIPPLRVPRPVWLLPLAMS